MRKFLLATTSVAGLTLSALLGAQAATIISVPMVPGAVDQTVFGINDSNVIAGAFHDSAGIEHGFYGTLDGNYTTFDVAGDDTFGTEPRYISPDGSIVGFLAGSGFAIGEEFYRRTDGSVGFPHHAGKPMDGVLQGTNYFHVSMGDYYNDSGVRVGYYAKGAHKEQKFGLRIEGWLQESPRKVTDNGTTKAGYFIDKDGAEHGFVQRGGTAQVIDYPGAALTVLEDINDHRQASGQWDDSSGNPHAFSLDTKTGTFTDIKIDDGSTFQQSWAINSNGLIPVSTSVGVSYIYCPHPASKCPGTGTEAKMPTFHVAPGTFLKYDRYGRTSKKLPPVASIKTHGMIQ